MVPGKCRKAVPLLCIAFCCFALGLLLEITGDQKAGFGLSIWLILLSLVPWAMGLVYLAQAKGYDAFYGLLGAIGLLLGLLVIVLLPDKSKRQRGGGPAPMI